MNYRSILLVFFLINIVLTQVIAQDDTERETDPLVLKKLEWFRDQKFGLFMHWGIYSQWGCIESWPLVEAMEWGRPSDLRAWIERDKNFNRFFHDYRHLNQTFYPQNFDPQRWVKIAQKAGMRYYILTTKHHDGFCMFDTHQTDYRTTHSSCPFHIDPDADIVKTAFKAFQSAGFGIGAYFSKSDWHHSDYWDLDRPHKTRHANYDTEKKAQKWQRFVNYVHAQVNELVTQYGIIDILWLDGGHVRPPKEDINMPKLVKMARTFQPGLVVVDRASGTRFENYKTPEQKVPEQALPYIWETCMTMGTQWSFKPNDQYKSARELIHLLVDIVAKGGNFLLNVGPNANGELPSPAIDRLEKIGRWMDVNSRAIYDTRAVKPYKQGQTCFTQKKSRIYLIHLASDGRDRPSSQIHIPAVIDCQAVNMLGTDQPIKWTCDKGGLLITLSDTILNHLPCEHAWAFQVEKPEIVKNTGAIN